MHSSYIHILLRDLFDLNTYTYIILLLDNTPKILIYSPLRGLIRRTLKFLLYLPPPTSSYLALPKPPKQSSWSESIKAVTVSGKRPLPDESLSKGGETPFNEQEGNEYLHHIYRAACAG